MRARLVLVAALLASAGSVLVGCAGGPGATAPDHEAPVVRVGGGPDAETVLLAHTLVALLGFERVPAEVVTFRDPRDTRQALVAGSIDLRPAYTGEAWLEDLGRPDPPGDPRESFAAVRVHDDERGLVWFRPRFGTGISEPPANATFAFVVAGPPAADADLATLSQLAARLAGQPEARVCVDPEFGVRADGLPAVLTAYSLRSDRPFLAADPREAVAGVVAGDCVAGLVSATDGVVWAAGLRPVEDDLRVFPAFLVLPQARQEVLDERPQVRTAVAPMATELSTELLGRWNARVAAGEPVEEVAAQAAAVLYERAGRRPLGTDPLQPPREGRGDQ